jgi:geranylgeranyl pyrophosphate synthase
MVYGQDQDMYWTGRSDYDVKTLERIHRGKTGALLGASAALGAIAGGASEDSVAKWREFGILVGLAFQAVDDVLDESDSTGKSKGKDREQGKLTFLRFHSNDEVLNLAKGYTAQAVALIPNKGQAQDVIDFVESLIFRAK